MWLLARFGDGEKAPCKLMISPLCQQWVTLETITVDRIVPGIDGGTYVRANIRPACAPCQHRQGQRLAIERRRRGRA